MKLISRRNLLTQSIRVAGAGTIGLPLVGAAANGSTANPPDEKRKLID